MEDDETDSRPSGKASKAESGSKSGKSSIKGKASKNGKNSKKDEEGYVLGMGLDRNVDISKSVGVIGSRSSSSWGVVFVASVFMAWMNGGFLR